MYSKVNVDDLDPVEVEEIDPVVRPVGYELRPGKMRPNVFVYGAGESNNRHRQTEQEELYLVLDGRLRMDVDDETFEIEAGDVVVVSPESWRRLTAIQDSEVFVVGAPNVKDDGIREGEE